MRAEVRLISERLSQAKEFDLDSRQKKRAKRVLKQDSNMVRFVLQESNFAGIVDERLEYEKKL